MSRADATRARLLEAATEEFARHGIAGARVDRIAAAARANKNLIYVYYTNKETLFRAVFEAHVVRLLGDVPFTPADLPGYAAGCTSSSGPTPGCCGWPPGSGWSRATTTACSRRSPSPTRTRWRRSAGRGCRRSRRTWC
jgi:hypothetical protein